MPVALRSRTRCSETWLIRILQQRRLRSEEIKVSCSHIWTLQAQVPNFHKYFVRHGMWFPREAASDSPKGTLVSAWVSCSTLQGHLPCDQWAALGIPLPPLGLFESAGDSRPLLCKSPGKLHSEVLAATSLDCCVCFGPESLRQGLPGGGDREWPGSHVAILPASGHTEYGPKLKTLPPRDSG